MDENYQMMVRTIPEREPRAYKYAMHRMSGWVDWLTLTGRPWYKPDFAAYRDYLLKKRELKPLTVNAHLSTIRSQYRRLLKDGTIYMALERAFAAMPIALRTETVQLTIAQIEQEVQVHSLLEEKAASVEHLRLKAEDILQLLFSPDPDTFAGCRNRAILALLFFTGIRAVELCALDVKDLMYEGKQVLHVPNKPGCIERVIPFDLFKWGLHWVKDWLERARISDGPLFRGFYKGSTKIRQSRLTIHAVENILAQYPITIHGQQVIVKPMDLRRAYARVLFEYGCEPADIKVYLGLKDSNALLDYIGDSRAELKIPPGVNFSQPYTLTRWFESNQM